PSRHSRATARRASPIRGLSSTSAATLPGPARSLNDGSRAPDTGRLRATTEPMATELLPERWAERVRTAAAFMILSTDENFLRALIKDAAISSTFMARVALPYALAGMDVGGVLERTSKLNESAGIALPTSVARFIVIAAKELGKQASLQKAAIARHT